MAVSEAIYERLTDDNDGRLCEDISERACRDTPRSFVLILCSYALTKLGDMIANPKTTLAWLTPLLGAPAWVLSLLVPIREAGAMIPQLIIGGWVRRLPRRKWVWVIGSVGQAACIAGLGLTAVTLTNAAAGWAILACVTAFSLFRALCSVAAKDVMGKTVSKTKRGQLSGWSASIAGLAALAVGVGLPAPLADAAQSTIAWVLAIAALLWLAAAAVYAQVPETEGATDGGRSIGAVFAQLRLLISDAPFRRFVLTRALLMCSALSAPFYVALAQTSRDSTIATLGGFIVAAGIADLVSGPVWGRFADVSSKRVMILSAIITAGIGLTSFAVFRWLPTLATSAWYLPLAYFILSLAHSGVRVGRSTYVVNLAGGNKRTSYVAVSNTVIGVLLLVVGAIGLLTPLIGNDGVIGLLALMGSAGALLGTTLRSV